MKPTQEQVVQWAREAEAYETDDPANANERIWLMNDEELQDAFTIAYEAGRKDENEACERLHEEMWASSVSADSTVEAFNGALKGYARAIRARREQ